MRPTPKELCLPSAAGRRKTSSRYPGRGSGPAARLTPARFAFASEAVVTPPATSAPVTAPTTDSLLDSIRASVIRSVVTAPSEIMSRIIATKMVPFGQAQMDVERCRLPWVTQAVGKQSWRTGKSRCCRIRVRLKTIGAPSTMTKFSWILAISLRRGPAFMPAFGTTHSDAEIAAAANCATTRFEAKTVKRCRVECGRLEKADLRM
jgi:hypothetical protein